MNLQKKIHLKGAISIHSMNFHLDITDINFSLPNLTLLWVTFHIIWKTGKRTLWFDDINLKALLCKKIDTLLLYTLNLIQSWAGKDISQWNYIWYKWKYRTQLISKCILYFKNKIIIYSSYLNQLVSESSLVIANFD